MSGLLSDGTITIDGVTHFVRRSATLAPVIWYGTMCGIRFSTYDPEEADEKICFVQPMKTLTCIPCTLGVVSE